MLEEQVNTGGSLPKVGWLQARREPNERVKT